MPRQQRIGLGIAILIGLVFATVGTVGLVQAGDLVWNTLSIRNRWDRAPGQVLSGRLERLPSNKTPKYAIRIQYSYIAAGERYKSDRYSYDPDEEYENDAAEEILERYPRGSEILAFVDPDNPENAVLSADLIPLLFPVAVSLLFACAGYGILSAPLYLVHLRKCRRALAEGPAIPLFARVVSFDIAFPTFWLLFTLTGASYAIRHGNTALILVLLVFAAAWIWMLRGAIRSIRLLWLFGGSRLEISPYPPHVGTDVSWTLRGRLRTARDLSFSLVYREETYDQAHVEWEGKDHASTELTAEADNEGWRGVIRIPSKRQEAAVNDRRRRGWCLAVTRGKRRARYFFRVTDSDAQ